MKKIALVVLVVIMASLLLCSCGEKTQTGYRYAEITFKDYGTVKLTLNATQAPITVANFVKLAEAGKYDGNQIIRVQQNFVIQSYMEEKVDAIKGEFWYNGVNNEISHERGVISMARSDSYNSATSDFFIMLANNTGLDGLYAAFGWVTEGMEIIDKIAADAKGKEIHSMGFLDPSAYVTIESVKITG